MISRTTRRLTVSLFALVAGAYTFSALAAPTYYTDRATFEAAAGAGLSFESFESQFGVGATLIFTDFSVSESGGTNALAPASGFAPFAITDGAQALAYDDNGASIGTFFGFVTPVEAFGLDLSTSEGSTVTIGGDVGDSVVLTAQTPAFWGVIDPDGISSISFDASGGPNVGFDAVSYGEADGAVSTNATFFVSKTFTNGDTSDVEVMLTCNGGLPLQQSFTISGGGPGVTFTVTNLPSTGIDCEVTETGGADGYTADLSACAWASVGSGAYSCPIENIPEPTALLIVTDFEGAEDPNIPDTFTTVLECTNVSPDTGSTFGTATESFVNIADASVNWYAKPGATSECTVELMPDASAVQSDTCSFSFTLGDATTGCTVVGTVFFEGIPTLSQYGMAIMALLMLGVGFVGMRRLV
ncbi:MAG: IPTL-CTERM sorting domain-containing protein [Xanthomonadales bacterium]|jgi:hypothetical protein|nr:IPTL-CTERM sorting domain-containing protein [Xanthomonadales bacterium]